MNGLNEIRDTFAKALMFFIWFNVLLVIGTSWFNPEVASVVISGIALLFGTMATAVWMQCGIGTETRIATSISLAGLVALFVASLAGGDPATSFQTDGHMYFFAVLAILAGWVDWRALLAYAAVVAVHHLVLNFALPLAVFPGGANFGRVVFHAVIVVIEVGALWWLTAQVANAFAASAKALQDAEDAHSVAMAAQTTVDEQSRLTEERQKGVAARIAGFRGDVEALLSGVSDRSRRLREASLQLGNLTSGTASQAATAAAASDKASDNVQTVASAAEELASSISEISRQVAQTTQIVAKATEGAQTSNAKVAGLANAASRIGEVVTLIQAIAEQTNLLALNATIEAARAGEAGRGFAVVAAEVKELATQTSKATEEIGAQISAIQVETKGAVEAIGAIALTMDDVNRYTSAIAAAVEEQGAATAEISRNVAQAAHGTELVASNISGLSASAEKTTGSVAHVATTAEELEQEAARMRAAIDGFLRDVA